MKMIRKETKIIKKFIQDLGFGKFFKVRNFSRMESDMGNKIVFYDKFWFSNYNWEIQKYNKEIRKYYKELGIKIGVHIGTFAILHEIGHLIDSYSYKDFDAKYIHYQKQVAKVYKIKDTYLREVAYKNITMEKRADINALKILYAFPKLVKQLDKDLKSAY
jgi:hypothetical protein